MTDYRHGWYALAFERDLVEPISPLTFGGRSLMAVRSGRGIRILDARCPHRGANLAFGGRLAGASLICPFHGHRIGLGQASEDAFAVREYAALVHGGVVFARLSDIDNIDQPDLPGALSAFGVGHTFVPGFELTAHTSIEMVMENGFDSSHFRAVHRLVNVPRLEIGTGPWQELKATGRFEIPRSAWHEPSGAGGTQLGARYYAHAFSPGVVVTELDGDPPFRYKVMTTATPTADGAASTVRLTLILPDMPDGAPADPRFVEDLLAASRAGLELDCQIWDRLDIGLPPQLTENDNAVTAFAEFCRPFRA